jgi:hypothetical protein
VILGIPRRLTLHGDGVGSRDGEWNRAGHGGVCCWEITLFFGPARVRVGWGSGRARDDGKTISLAWVAEQLRIQVATDNMAGHWVGGLRLEELV